VESYDMDGRGPEDFLKKNLSFRINIFISKL